MTLPPRRDWPWACFLLCWFSAIGLSAPLEVRQVGSQLQPLWDDWLIESLDNVRHILHSPKPGEIVLRRDRPWEDQAIYNPVVIRDGYRYRMWYRARAVEKPIYTAYAESLDGIHWVKPNLGDIVPADLLVFEGGDIVVPDRPGMGIELDRDMVEKYARNYEEDGPFWPCVGSDDK